MGVAPLLRQVLRFMVGEPEAMPDRLIARYLAPYVGRDGVSHLLVLARSIRTAEIDELELDAIAAPTLIIWGDRDGFLDPEDGDRLAKAIPRARIVPVPDVGRLIPEEDPQLLSVEIHEFAGVIGTAAGA